LPTPDKYLEIKKKFLEEEWGKLEDKEYFIIRNRDNVMTVVLQNVNNKRQMNFIRPDTVVFFGRNTADPECKE